jgi:APA family basic amino acid/polyamine antiporter
MAEELAFARKASGLVRGLSFWDVFGIGLAFITPIYAIWYIIEVGLTLYPAANLLLAVLISVLTIGWASPIVWGVLGGTMPRSGGEYIYNSRIINPAVALGASFTAICAQFYWNLFNASLIAVPSLAILGQYLGWHGLADFATGKAGGCIISVIGIGIGFLILAFGMKFFSKLSKGVILVMLGGVTILDIALTFASRASFISHWNAQAAKYHSITYQNFVSAAHTAGAATPLHWSWGDTFGATAGVFMIFIWAFGISYVGGEVKRPDKTVMRAQWAAVGLPVLLCVWALLAINHIIPFDFLRAAAFQDFHAATKGYNLPYSTSYMSISYIASGGNWFIALVAGLTFMVTAMWLVVVNLLMCQRAMFAWGMDRMGPKWFTAVSGRYSSPIGMFGFVAAISAFLSVAYWYLFPSVLSGLFASGMQLVSVFAVTAISAIIFAYRKKVRHIWDASPYNRWKFLGVPVLTIAGSVYLCYIVALIYFAFFDSKTKDITGKKAWLMVIAWAAGILWYFAWKWRSKRVGVDVTQTTYGQLPPE